MALDLDALTIAFCAATPGEWRHGNDGQSVVTDGTNGDEDTDQHYGGRVVCETIGRSDRDWVIGARSLWPDLVKELEATRARVRGAAPTRGPRRVDPLAVHPKAVRGVEGGQVTVATADRAMETDEERRARLLNEAEAMYAARRAHAQAVEARRIGTKAMATEGMEAWSRFGDDPRGGVIVEITETVVEETGELIRRYVCLNPYKHVGAWECSMAETEVMEDGIRLATSSRLVGIARRLARQVGEGGGIATPRDEKRARWAHRLIVIAMGGGR